jgi:hypothetical protein
MWEAGMALVFLGDKAVLQQKVSANTDADYNQRCAG